MWKNKIEHECSYILYYSYYIYLFTVDIDFFVHSFSIRILHRYNTCGKKRIYNVAKDR